MSWKSRLQPIVALSSTEAEYITVTAAAQEGIWLRRVMGELGFEQVEQLTKWEQLTWLLTMREQSHYRRTHRHILAQNIFGFVTTSFDSTYRRELSNHTISRPMIWELRILILWASPLVLFLYHTYHLPCRRFGIPQAGDGDHEPAPGPFEQVPWFLSASIPHLPPSFWNSLLSSSSAWTMRASARALPHPPPRPPRTLSPTTRGLRTTTIFSSATPVTSTTLHLSPSMSMSRVKSIPRIGVRSTSGGEVQGPVQGQRSEFGCVLTHISHIYLVK